MKWFVSVVVTIGLLAGVGIYMLTSFGTRPAGLSQEEIFFEVKPGESFASVAKRLADIRLISNDRIFSLWARVNNLRGKIKAGEYVLRQSMTPNDIIKIIATGKSLTYPFTISEGLNIYEIAILIEKAGYGSKADFLKACADQSLLQSLLGDAVTSCEGYIFPETYMLTKKTTALDFVKIAVKMFESKWKEKEKDLQRAGWSRHRIVTLASIIEKETGAPEERPIIASVFHNRLSKGMRLQTDPTVLYGILDSTKVYRQNITRADLETPTKYNTYTMAGLPPGPISNPGMESLMAAVRPSATEYLYFVSKNDGTHVFTSTYDDHRKAVGGFQLNSKAREGKSWRDLQKNREKKKAN